VFPPFFWLTSSILPQTSVAAKKKAVIMLFSDTNMLLVSSHFQMPASSTIDYLLLMKQIELKTSFIKMYGRPKILKRVFVMVL